MTTPLLSRQLLLITLGAMLSLEPAPKAQGQAAPEGLAIPATHFDVSPYVGLYLPFGSMLRPTPPSQVFTSPYGPSVTSIAQRSAIAFGGHLTVWLAPRFGLGGTLSYALSGVSLGCCNGGHVTTGSVRLVVVPLTFSSLPSAFHVSGGIGMVDHGGQAYQGVTGTTRVAPSIGAGLALKLGASGLLRMDLEDYPFRPHLSLGSGCIHYLPVCNALIFQGPGVPGFQHDVILSVGLGWRNHSQSAR